MEVLSKRRPDIRLLLIEARPSGVRWRAGRRSRRTDEPDDLAQHARLAEFFAVSKLLLMPSLMENAGFIAMEAMTNGIPVAIRN